MGYDNEEAPQAQNSWSAAEVGYDNEEAPEAQNSWCAAEVGYHQNSWCAAEVGYDLGAADEVRFMCKCNCTFRRGRASRVAVDRNSESVRFAG